jgi:hypothetical protein
MKIDRKMEIGGKPFKIYDQENDGVTTLWSSNGQRNFPQMSREKKLIAEDIFGLLTFRYTWGGFGDLTLREQLENKFDSFWYNAKANRYWFQFLFPLMEGQPQLKNLVAEKLQLDFTGVSRLKVRDSDSESIAKAIWEARKMRDIYEPFKDAFFSQRGTALLPEQEGSSLEKGTIVIAMKLNEGQGASFAGVRVFSDDSRGLKSAIQKEATKLYRGFIAPHTSIFENRMRDEYMKGGYTVYDSEGYNELMAAELEAMIPTLFGGNVSIRSASSGDSLRNKVIRLAHSNPELRKDLLPLLKEARLHDKALALRIQNSKAGKAYGLYFAAGFKSNRADSDGAITYEFETNIQNGNFKEVIYIDVTKWDSGDEMYSVQAKYGKGTWDHRSEKDLLKNLPSILANLEKQLG